VIPGTRSCLCGIHDRQCVTDGEEPTSDDESDVSQPYARRNSHNELVLIPNGDTSDTYEYISRDSGRIEKALTGTYMRSTIKREEATMAR
jgi:hypothetical protein